MLKIDPLNQPQKNPYTASYGWGLDPRSPPFLCKKKKQKFDFVSKEKRREAIKEIIAYFQDERDEEIGIIAAGDILDFFMDSFGEEIYMKAIKDSKKMLRGKFEDLDIELDLLIEHV